MAGQINNATVKKSDDARLESVKELMVDIDLDDSAENNELNSADKNGKILFEKSTDIRRRIEEKLEVKLLKDELGIDYLDI